MPRIELTFPLDMAFDIVGGNKTVTKQGETQIRHEKELIELLDKETTAQTGHGAESPQPIHFSFQTSGIVPKLLNKITIHE